MTACVATVGLAVIDSVYRVETLPTHAAKHFAHDHAIALGGIAANAALTVARLGGAARMIGRRGDDWAGIEAARVLGNAGVDTDGFRAVPGRATPTSAVMIDRNGERMSVNHKDIALFEAAPEIALAGADSVLCDLRWPAGAASALTAARNAGIPGIVDFDSAPEDPGAVLSLASHIVFGEDALAALAPGAPPDALAALSRARPAALAVTCGSDGIHWRAGAAHGHIPAHDVAAVDTLGAGDIFHGAVALALAEGQGFVDALGFANAVAAVKVTRPSGPDSIPTRPQVAEFLRSRP